MHFHAKFQAPSFKNDQVMTILNLLADQQTDRQSEL